MTSAGTEAVPGFTVHLANFEGPFDLLLQLIFAQAKRNELCINPGKLLR